ncbi:uncharacterized protein F5891DRAFT_1008767 [Suillus fuscotomentosus]|uniref:Uncharacterized protein n=1 Tax=Suillus fuscotomentosus TaxID=1912939 RepID=A0AAD4EFR2_9AGAM|nr:uncharacterized protein F5891DRAFT_1008767 [Suillus fuscotomentosus]KAG1905317.1 hypothetical protein F5891DRAFT_1008767 [Suillus fuscotomentosus]
MDTHDPYDDPETPFIPTLGAKPPPTTRGRKLSRRTICTALAGISLLGFGFLLLKPSSHLDTQDVPSYSAASNSPSYLQGPPTQRFRDNLRNDTKYITSFTSAGWTNDVMTYGNLIYLALLTERIPIIAKFLSSHIDSSEPPFAFGEIFDVPRLSQAIGIPVLEWHEVKDSESQVLDDLGGWSVWESVERYTEDPRPRASPIIDRLKLDISWTRTPDWVKLTPPDIIDDHASFWSLATLAFPQARSENLGLPNRPSPQHHVSLLPDDQLLCFDFLYFIAAQRPWEWEMDYSPAWRFVGQHMRWNATMEKLADAHARRAMNVPGRLKPVPPYISVHIRHGDFRDQCHGLPVDQCFASLSIIARRVSEVQEELRTRKGIEVTHVIMTSDESDPEWWSEVRALGWTWVDYATDRTEEIYGKWYPVFIDAIIQSNGAGFVGTRGSTMSNLALRRVQTWHNGPTRIVQWGWPGADDH